MVSRQLHITRPRKDDSVTGVGYDRPAVFGVMPVGLTIIVSHLFGAMGLGVEAAW